MINPKPISGKICEQRQIHKDILKLTKIRHFSKYLAYLRAGLEVLSADFDDASSGAWSLADPDSKACSLLFCLLFRLEKTLSTLESIKLLTVARLFVSLR